MKNFKKSSKFLVCMLAALSFSCGYVANLHPVNAMKIGANIETEFKDDDFVVCDKYLENVVLNKDVEKVLLHVSTDLKDLPNSLTVHMKFNDDPDVICVRGITKNSKHFAELFSIYINQPGLRHTAGKSVGTQSSFEYYIDRRNSDKFKKLAEYGGVDYSDLEGNVSIGYDKIIKLRYFDDAKEQEEKYLEDKKEEKGPRKDKKERTKGKLFDGMCKY